MSEREPRGCVFVCGTLLFLGLMAIAAWWMLSQAAAAVA